MEGFVFEYFYALRDEGDGSADPIFSSSYEVRDKILNWITDRDAVNFGSGRIIVSGNLLSHKVYHTFEEFLKDFEE